MKLRLPQSLTAQFALAVSILALLIVASGATAIYALSNSAHAIQELADKRLASLQDAQDLVRYTLLIERKALALSGIDTLDGVRETHRQVIKDLESFDHLVDRLVAAAPSDNVDVLDVHRASQLFRNTINVVAQLRESALIEAATQTPPRGVATLRALDDELESQSELLATVASQQSAYFTRDYRDAVQQLAEASNRTRWWVVGLVGVSLLLTGVIMRGFLGRHVVARLRLVSHHLRRGDADGGHATVPVQGGDEIADMARAVEQFLEDRRQRRQAEAQLTAARDAAIAAQRAQATFLTNMSHELRTPLNAILGYAQLLRRDRGLTEKQASAMFTVQKSGEHLLGLINDLLDLSRIEAGKLELHLDDVELAGFLQSIADTIRVKAQEKRLAFDLVFKPDWHIAVRADEQRLRQVLLNLLGNAVKFTDKGRVSLRVTMLRGPDEGAGREVVEMGDARLRFEVEDTGIGIAADDIKSIFQPFEQVGQVAHRAGGTGLGLAISRQLVHMMGSEIHVESRPEVHDGSHGSRFWFELTLPLVQDAAATARRSPEVSGYRGPRRRILVVDDVDANRRLIGDCLAPLGFDLEEAINGEQALARAKDFRPDLVLMDNAMPVMDGLEAIRRLRCTPGLQAVPIISISAAAYKQDEEKSLAAGADAFLPKPIEIGALRECIGKVLGLEWVGR